MGIDDKPKAVVDEKVNEFREANKNALEAMGIELRKQLLFIEEVIREDRENLMLYKEMHGDLKYRPNTGDGFGEPTTLSLTPAMDAYRMVIKNILESLTLIENKLGTDTGRGEANTNQDSEKLNVGKAFDAGSFLKKPRN